MGNYIGIVLGILALIAYVWKASADYTTLKNMQENMVTKFELSNMLAELTKTIRDEFVTRREHEQLWGLYRELRNGGPGKVRGEE